MAEVEFPSESGESNNAIQKDEARGCQHVKKPRKRLKRICSQIRQQMEFYFSDANLQKDGFVKQLIDKREDRYVHISAFSNFNKLRELTTDMKLVVKALSTSDFFEVKEDKEHIRRKTPYSEPKDVDDRTIYVESLPRDVDHDWLQQTFTPYGKVVYVSLPRYRTTGDIKGFAFIEFETKEALEKACQSYQPLNPDDEKAAHFPKYNKQLQTLQKQISATGEKVEERKPKRRLNSNERNPETDSEPTSTKRQKRPSECSDTEPADREKVRLQEADAEKGRKRAADSEVATGDAEGREETKRSKSSADDKPADGQSKEKEKDTNLRKRKRSEESEEKNEEDEHKKIKKEESNEDGTKKKEENVKKEEIGGGNEKETSEDAKHGVMVDRTKRKRLSDVTEPDAVETREVKRVRISELVDVKENVEVTHKKQRNKKKKKKENREKTEEVKPQLKVIPKQVWLELRKEYLELQRSSMKALKKSLKKIKKRQAKVTESGSLPLNTYVGIEERTAADVEVAASRKGQPAGVQFTPGVIIKVDTDQPSMRKELKETLSLVAAVSYVDFQDGDQQGYVRCATQEDALRVIASRPGTFRVSLLQGADETEYWRKVSADRDQKRAVKTRTKKRGAQKLMERAEKTIISGAPQKHIVFDD